MSSIALRPESLDGLGEVEVDAAAYAVDLGADAAALVAHVLGLPRGDVAGDQVAEGGVDPLEVVVAVVLGDVARVLVGVLGVLGDPDAAVVAQRLAHQGELGLVGARDRDAGRVDLGVAGVGHVGALAVRPPGRGDVAAHGVGREEEDVAVATAGEDHYVGEVGLELAGDHVAHDDAAGAAVDDDQLDHLVAGVGLHGAGGDLALERLVGADQQLLAGLAAGVEGARDLHAAEGAVVEQAAVLAGERDALGDALVDDVPAHLGEAVDVRLARAVVAALDRVVEEPVDRVAVALVVLGGVDAALGGDRVGATRGVLVAERLHHVAGLAERRGRGGAGQAGADHDHREAATVGRVGDPGLELAGVPALVDRAAGRLGVLDRVAGGVVAGGVVGLLLAVHVVRGIGGGGGVGHVCHVSADPCYLEMTPARTKIGTSENPTVMIRASTKPNELGPVARVLVVGQAQGLQRAPDPVVQVGAEHRHREQVDQREPPGLERVDQQVVGVVGRAAGDVDLADGEVQQVPDDEQQQGHAAPAHQVRGVRRVVVLLHDVLDACGPAWPGATARRRGDVRDQRRGSAPPG